MVDVVLVGGGLSQTDRDLTAKSREPWSANYPQGDGGGNLALSYSVAASLSYFLPAGGNYVIR
jgi:hypothetical protein